MEIKTKAAPIFEEYGIKQASVFGSVARGEAGVNSDIDIMITLGDKPIGLFSYMRFINKMEKSLGRRVDVVTLNSLNKFIKPYVLPELKIIYEK